ncbi:mitochondrial glycine transporter A-like [Asterias rubens]|uniref:mitochondrial glycine transporter A-like n=1 Tax=Asterias rubens TaxID=7604 RepID=UPI0014555481|nr:mitochondrial glycine transporter A-like [Asterias rubens]
MSKSTSKVDRKSSGDWKNMELFNSPIFKSFVAGSLSGTCSTVLLQPLDLVKTRIQSPAALEHSHRGIFYTISSVVRHEKILGLWRGVIPSVSRTVPGVGLYFCSLHTLKTKLGWTDPNPLQAITLGMLARCVAGGMMLPVTVVKTRYESEAYQYKTVRGALKSIYNTEGTKGLFSGMAATLLRDAPFSGIYLLFYTQTKKAIPPDMITPHMMPTINFSSGLLAGVLASAVTQPADVIKTHMQLYPQKHKKVMATVQYVIKKSGVNGLFRGMLPRCLRRTLMASLAWTVYEQVIVKFGLK